MTEDQKRYLDYLNQSTTSRGDVLLSDAYARMTLEERRACVSSPHSLHIMDNRREHEALQHGGQHG